MKIQVNSHDPYHVTVKHFLHEHECDGIIEALGSQLELWNGIKIAAMKKSIEWEDIRVMKKYMFCQL